MPRKRTYSVSEQRPSPDEGERLIWTKWSDDRTEVAQLAAKVWLPLDDLRDFLNRLPGDRLSETDVYQRLCAIWETEGRPLEELRQKSLLHYTAEKVKGTEFIANLRSLRLWMEEATHLQYRARWAEEARQKAIVGDQRLRTGEDWPKTYGAWATAIGFPGEYIRKRGRLFRYNHSILTEIDALEDVKGVIIGTFPSRYKAAQHVHNLTRDQSKTYAQKERIR